MAIRIYALANEFGCDSKDLVTFCLVAGILGKGSALASLSDGETQIIRDYVQELRRGSEAAFDKILKATPKTLSISGLGIERIPEGVFRSNGLAGLLLQRNRISSLSESIGQLSRLTHLHLADNRLSKLPESIGQLDRLQVLELGNNQLAALPECIGGLHQLTRLDLSNNRLLSLPTSLKGLVGLQSLDLSGNQLTTLPEWLGDFAQLTELILSRCQLSTLPESMTKLVRLQKLDLWGNQLTVLPAYLGELPALQELDFSNNRLATLPRSLWNLARRKLQVSSVSMSGPSDSAPPQRQLQRLYLHGNEALGIPPEILGPRSVSSAITQRSPMVRGYGEESKKPADALAILDFFFKRQDEARRKLREAKMLLVGQGGVGKTSLVRRLMGQEFLPDQEQTEGINIVNWQVEVERVSLNPTTPSTKRRSRRRRKKQRSSRQFAEIASPLPSGKEAEIRLNVWDFGGQEIMHATHQFFLTKRSLYVLVLDARAGEQEGNLHYWLKTIQSYGGDSPVLVVVNKCEPPHHLPLDERRLMLDYAPNVVGVHYISCQNGHGIRELRLEIDHRIGEMPHVNDELPKSYFDIKEELELRASQEDFITQEQYSSVCRQHGVNDATAQQHLLQFLHDLGCVLHYDDPRQVYQIHDTNVLNPEWVTGGVYRIVMNHELRARGDGKVSLARLGEFLRGSGRYPPQRHRFLLDLMRKFDLCFAFPDGLDLFLVPELLSPNEPDVGWDMGETLDFQMHYSVLPRGLLPRFIVRTHHLLTKNPTYWRSGVVLEIDGCRVLVRGDTRQARVFIQVQGGTGAERRRALAVVRDHFQAIHAAIPRLEAKAQVPLPNDPQAPCVDYEYLCRLEREGVDRMLFPEASKPYSIRELLDGIDELNFDVFLSHDSRDKPAVRELAKLLRQRGVRPWLDEMYLTPGEPWKRELVEAVEFCRTVAVLLGPSGIGPWELEEARLALDEAVRLKKRLIPVLLPNAAEPSELLPPEWRMLEQRTRVDFRTGFLDEKLDSLCRGICD
jgi:internalin A